MRYETFYFVIIHFKLHLISYNIKKNEEQYNRDS